MFAVACVHVNFLVIICMLVFHVLFVIACAFIVGVSWCSCILLCACLQSLLMPKYYSLPKFEVWIAREQQIAKRGVCTAEWGVGSAERTTWIIYGILLGSWKRRKIGDQHRSVANRESATSVEVRWRQTREDEQQHSRHPTAVIQPLRSNKILTCFLNFHCLFANC